MVNNVTVKKMLVNGNLGAMMITVICCYRQNALLVKHSNLTIVYFVLGHKFKDITVYTVPNTVVQFTVVNLKMHSTLYFSELHYSAVSGVRNTE